MAQKTFAAQLRFLTAFGLLAAVCSEPDGLIVPLRRKDGGLIARGLLRNATLPLHGAVKDYG